MGSSSSNVRESMVLLKDAQGGDPKALNALLTRYFERVLRIVRARLGGKLRGRHDSMDIAQGAMVRVLQGLGKFEPKSEGALIQWMSKLVENEIRDLADYHDAKKRRLSKEIPILPSTTSRVGLESRLQDLSQKSPSQQVALGEDLLSLEKAMDKLGKEREPILLREYAGLTFKEIAQELHLSEDAARMRYVRAMDKLTDLVTKISPH